MIFVCVTVVGAPLLTVIITSGLPPAQTVEAGGVLVPKVSDIARERGNGKFMFRLTRWLWSFSKLQNSVSNRERRVLFSGAKCLPSSVVVLPGIVVTTVLVTV